MAPTAFNSLVTQKDRLDWLAGRARPKEGFGGMAKSSLSEQRCEINVQYVGLRAKQVGKVQR